MTDDDLKRAISLVMHFEYFTPQVHILHENGFEDGDIASFFGVDLRKVLEARGVAPDPYLGLFPDEDERQLIARINAPRIAP